jgi:chemotaxis protein MotB
MNKTMMGGMTWMFVMLLLAGCGASAKEKQMMADLTSAQAQTARQSAQIDSLDKQNTALQGQIEQAMAQAAALAAQQDSLRATQQQTVTKYDEVVKQLSSEVQSGNLQITQYKNMLTVDVAEKLFFASGSASLKKSGQDVLHKVADAISGYPDKIIRVVGHTDSLALAKNARFASNWELSVMRATNVVHFLQDQCHIAPERLIAAGRGPYQPVADNSTPEGRQKNRRIEIMLIDKGMVDSMGGPAAAKDPVEPGK